jgi:hypothetical protein
MWDALALGLHTQFPGRLDPRLLDALPMNQMSYESEKQRKLSAILARQIHTQADFTYSISGNVISIVDLNSGNRSVTNDVENVLRKIEHFHQAPSFGFKIMYRDSQGIWDGIQWMGNLHPFLRCAKPKKDELGRNC